MPGGQGWAQGGTARGGGAVPAQILPGWSREGTRGRGCAVGGSPVRRERAGAGAGGRLQPLPGG